MAQRKHPFAIGEYYHLYSRGVEKRKIFLDRADYQRFLFLLYICNTSKSITIRDLGKKFERGKTITDVGAFCLMPNHFHLLIKEKQENGISTFMRKLMTAYSMYFNKKYERSGTLFEGAFKSVNCSTDQYLKYLYSYIHLNPAKIIDKDWRKSPVINKIRILDYVSQYPYSSFQEYLLKPHIINPYSFPEYFTNIENHKKEFFDWLTLTEEIPM